MTHKVKVYRKKYYNRSIGDYCYQVSFAKFTEALTNFGLSTNLRKRRSKDCYFSSPTGVDLASYTADIFTFVYSFKEKQQFFENLGKLKDDAEIAKWYWIGD